MFKRFYNKIKDSLRRLFNEKSKETIKENLEKFIKLSRSFFLSRVENLETHDVSEELIDKEEAYKLNKANALYFFIIAFTVCFVIWGSIAKLDKSIMANGQIKPADKIQEIQSLFTGKIEAIHIEEGQLVKEGDPLFSIDAAEVIANRDKMENQYYMNLAKISRLESQISPDKELIFPDEVIKERPNFVLLESQLYESNKIEMEILEKQLLMTEELYKEGAESEMGFLMRKKDFMAQKTSYLTELTRAEEALSDAEASLPSLRLRAEQSIVKSPVDGIISNINVTTLGGVIDSGFKLAEVVPNDSELIAEVRVDPKDASFVFKGMEALVSITSFDESVYGKVTGKVKNISANTREGPNGELYYIANITLEVEEFNKKINSKLQPGMVAMASILGDKRTILGYLFSPVSKLQSSAFREK
tara:strand:+ start:965 stop:2218 length:1254 start_codon:yes stop_codon:yes gene_type:complete